MLDPAGRGEVLDAVGGLRREGLSIVFVTQEMDEAVGADRVVALREGAVTYDGPVRGLFRGDHERLRRLGLGLPPAGGARAGARGARPCARRTAASTLDELTPGPSDGRGGAAASGGGASRPHGPRPA